MSTSKESAPVRKPAGREAFAMLREMATDLDRFFEQSAWPSLRWPALRARMTGEPERWFPEIDVLEQDKHLIARVDLPGVKKEDIHVEVAEGHLMISGERKSEYEEKKDNFYRCERVYGRFTRTIPVPAGVAPDAVKASFTNGVLEVRVPLPTDSEAGPTRVAVQDT